MKPGGGAAKGAAFEREVGVKLSIWLTKGSRADLFSRNVLSGGRFTNAVKVGKELAMPGDLMPAHELAFPFTDKFMIECKHHQDLHLIPFLMDRHAKSPLQKIISFAEEQAGMVGRQWVVIARQNRLPILIFMPQTAGEIATKIARPKHAFYFHRLHKDSIFMARFEDFISLVDPNSFLLNFG